MAEEIRRLLPDAIVESDLLGRGLGKGLARAGQLARDSSRHAFRIGKMHAVLLGSNERETECVTLKDLLTGAQDTFPRRQLAERLGGRER